MCRIHGLYDAAELLHEELQLVFVLFNISCHQHCNLNEITKALYSSEALFVFFKKISIMFG